MDVTDQIELFKEMIENVSKELNTPLDTFFSKLNREYGKLITTDNSDDIPLLFITTFNKSFPKFKKLGFNFLGMGDTRVAISLGDYVFKMDHTKYPKNLKGNKRELSNLDYLNTYSKDMATLFVNPIIASFPFNGRTVIVYRKCKMYGEKKFTKLVDSSQFSRDLAFLFSFITNDYHDMNVGYFGKYPIFVDIDSLSTNCSHDKCQAFNILFNELQAKYPKELQAYIRSKNKWLAA